jgi:hypothetical protein
MAFVIAKRGCAKFTVSQCYEYLEPNSQRKKGHGRAVTARADVASTPMFRVAKKGFHVTPGLHSVRPWNFEARLMRAAPESAEL